MSKKNSNRSHFQKQADFAVWCRISEQRARAKKYARENKERFAGLFGAKKQDSNSEAGE